MPLAYLVVEHRRGESEVLQPQPLAVYAMSLPRSKSSPQVMDIPIETPQAPVTDAAVFAQLDDAVQGSGQMESASIPPCGPREFGLLSFGFGHATEPTTPKRVASNEFYGPPAVGENGQPFVVAEDSSSGDSEYEPSPLNNMSNLFRERSPEFIQKAKEKQFPCAGDSTRDSRREPDVIKPSFFTKRNVRKQNRTFFSTNGILHTVKPPK